MKLFRFLTMVSRFLTMTQPQPRVLLSQISHIYTPRLSMDYSSKIRQVCIFTFGIATLFPLSHAAGVNNINPIVSIQYRAIIDETAFGHSGLPAAVIFDQLATATPENLAYKKILDELEEVEDLELLQERVAAYLLEHQAELANELRAYKESLISDVEPLCEPAAVVLNDALATEQPDTFNPDLVELALFYPPGQPEPAWADLIRTRRFVVYTDGASYYRLFLPGSDPAIAWQSAFAAIRHVLLSLIKSENSEEILRIDIYAYENDIATTTLKLNLKRYTLALAPRDLGSPAGLRALDLAALTQFFAAGQTLEGAGIDRKTGQLVLIGSKGKQPTLEGHPIELSDLAVAYRASAYAGHGETYMSLDPTGDAEIVNVNFGGRLHDTRLGWVAYRSDLRLKTLGGDFDPVTFEPLAERIRAEAPDYQSQQMRQFSSPQFREVSTEFTRFWFYPDDFKITKATDGKACLVTNPRFTAAAERQEGYDQEGASLAKKTPPWTTLTLKHFNDNYEKFAAIFPEIGELDHAARLLGVAEWLSQARKKRIIAADLDQLLAVELPASPTPRTRAQLQIIYAVKKTGIPANFETHLISTPRGQFSFAQKSGEYNQEDSEYDLFQVVSGGLDLSPRAQVKKAATADQATQSILNEVLNLGEVVASGNGKRYISSGVYSQADSPASSAGRRPITKSMAKVGPIGSSISGKLSSFAIVNGNKVDALQASEPHANYFQKSDPRGYFQNGPVHSIWADEHGRPERFATNTNHGLVIYRFSGSDRVLDVEVIGERRTPTTPELDLLAAYLSQGHGPLSQAWNIAPVDANIIAIDMTPNKDVLIYYRDGVKTVLRVYSPETEPYALEGQAALMRMHEASRLKAREFSEPGKVEIFHLAHEGNNVVVQIGRREPVRIQYTQWSEWLEAKEGTPPPDALAPVFSELANSGAEVVVLRDALQSRPQRLQVEQSQELELLDLLSKLERVLLLAEYSYSTEEINLRIDTILELKGDKSRRDADLLELERVRLETIRNMSAEERAAKARQLQYELTNDESNADGAAANALAATLSAKLPGIRFGYDDPSPLVVSRVMSEPKVQKAADVGLAVPPDEAGVDDKGILQTVAAAFKRANIPLIQKPEDLQKVGSVIVVAAHNNEALFNYLQYLGEFQVNGKSALDGKFVLLTTCFDKGNPNMISELLRRYNCSGIHVQSEKVDKDAVKRVLIEFAKVLRDLNPEDPPERLRDIYDNTIKRILRAEDPDVDALRRDLEKLMRSGVQWSSAGPSLPLSLTTIFFKPSSLRKEVAHHA